LHFASSLMVLGGGRSYRGTAATFRRELCNFTPEDYLVTVDSLVDQLSQNANLTLASSLLRVCNADPDVLERMLSSLVGNEQLQQGALWLPRLRELVNCCVQNTYALSSQHTPLVLLRLAELWADVNEHEEAVKCLKRAVMLSPGRKDVCARLNTSHGRLALMFESLGQTQKAERQRAYMT
jgi:hypothetical protein